MNTTERLARIRAMLSNPKNFDYARDDMGHRVGSRKYMMLSMREAQEILALLPADVSRGTGR